MTPIINPALFYWIQVLDTTRIVAITICVFGTLASGITIGCSFDASFTMDEFRERIAGMKKALIAVVVVIVVCLLLAIFIPSEETMTRMIVARTITPDNVSGGIEAVKEAVDYIVQKIAEIK